MNTETLARGWALIAEGASLVSDAYASIDSPARAGVTGTEGAKVSPPSPSSVPARSFDEPEQFMADVERVTGGTEIPLKPQVDAGLGKCPTHGTAWTVKAAGVSKAGKRYSAFWKCSERDADGYCDQKPQPIWAQTHPAEAAA